MAATRRKSSSTTTRRRSTKKAETAATTVVGTTTEKEQQNEALIGSEVVTLRVSLRRGYTMDDIPDGKGSTKCVTLPALDSALKGSKVGILTPEGNALFVQLSRTDWENVKRIHGRERMFNSYKGNPPCVAEVESLAAAKAGAYADEIAEVKTGYAPADPAKLGVEEDKGE